MKNPRDIVLVGTGFLLGIIFCYFLTAARLVEPKTGGTTAGFLPASQATNLLAGREANLFPKKADGVHVDDPSVTFEIKSRYVPVRRVNGMFRVNAPGVMTEPPAQYDLIDFHYVPDFKLPVD